MGSPATKSPTPEVPVVDLDRIRTTYAELKRMEVRLDPNPIEYGPQRFNNRIAQVRSMLNRVDQIFLQVSEDLHLFKRVINAKRTLYEFDKRELMVNDPRCRVGRSQGEREALADVQLRDILEELADLESKAHDLETLMISVKSKRTDLKDAQGRMRDQMKLIEHDISMGARWGSSAAPAMKDLTNVIASVNDGFGIVSGAEAEEEEEEEDDEEEVVAVDAGHDPSPHAPEEPVLVFGETETGDDDEDMEATEDEAGEEDAESLIPDEGADGELPEASSTEEDVDSFLTTFDESSNGDDEEEDDDDVSGIDDLIASLADDD